MCRLKTEIVKMPPQGFKPRTLITEGLLPNELLSPINIQSYLKSDFRITPDNTLW